MTLGVAAWFITVAMYFRDISAVWDMMKISLHSGGGAEFAYAIMNIYLFFLVLCGCLTLIYLGWLLYYNQRGIADLVMIIRFDADNSQSVFDLESPRNTSRIHRAKGDSRQANPAHSTSAAMSSESQVNTDQSLNFDSDRDTVFVTPSSSDSTTRNDNRNIRYSHVPNRFRHSDEESCSSCDSEYTKTIPSTRPAKQREPLTPTVPNQSSAPLASDADGEMTDANPARRLDSNRERKCGKYVRMYSQIARIRQGRERRPQRVEALEPVDASRGLIEGLDEAGSKAESISAQRAGLEEHRESIQALGKESSRSRGGTEAQKSCNLSNGVGDVSSFSENAVIRRRSFANTETHEDGTSVPCDPDEEQDDSTERKDLRRRAYTLEQDYQPTDAALSESDLPGRHLRTYNIPTNGRDYHQAGRPMGAPGGTMSDLRISIPAQRSISPNRPTAPVTMQPVPEWVYNLPSSRLSKDDRD